MAKQILINGRTSKFNSTDWCDSATGVEVKVKKDSFLDECAGYTDDEWWSSIITQMSRGKYPAGLTYYNGTLIVNSDKLALNIDPEIACGEIISFLQTYLNLYSPNDPAPDEEEEIEIHDSSGDVWSTMLKKHKEQAIIRFMLNEQQEKGLSHTERDRLHQILNFGFTLKYFHKDNVVVSNYTIISIDALLYDPDTRIYTIDKSQRKKENRAAARSNVKPKKNYNDVWHNICNKVIDGSLDNDDQLDESLIDEEYSQSLN